MIVLYFSEALEKAKNEIEGDIEENKEAIEELKKWQTEIKKDKETICEVFNEIQWDASSRWSFPLYCPMRNSGQMTIGKTHPRLYVITFIVLIC